MKSLHTTEYEHFLKILISARKKAGITQQELAKSLKKPQSFISKYERGERRLDVIELLSITKALKVDPSQILQKLTSPKERSK